MMLQLFTQKTQKKKNLGRKFLKKEPRSDHFDGVGPSPEIMCSS